MPQRSRPPSNPADPTFSATAALQKSGVKSDGSERPRISNLTFPELSGISLQLVGRLEVIWQRVVYIHAAMIGVMVFFSQAETGYTLARGIVYAFYSVNLLIAYFNLREIYTGLEAARSDMEKFPECSENGSLFGWMKSRNYAYKSGLRALILGIAWVLVGALLFLDLPWN